MDAAESEALRAFHAREDRDRTGRDIVIMLLVLVLAFAALVYPDDRLAVRTDTPFIQTNYEASAFVTVTVPRHPDNEALELLWTCGREDNRSRFSHDGDAPRVLQVKVTHLTAGECVVVVRLYRAMKVYRQAKTTIRVV